MRIPLDARTAGALLLPLLSACASLSGSSHDVSESQLGRQAIVIDGEALHDRSSDLLGMIEESVASMNVTRTRGCPQITMRGRKSLNRGTDPGIYVDGQRAGDTCILTVLNPSDLASVEVYPMGVTSRQGYHMDGAGLILVFTRSGQQ